MLEKWAFYYRLHRSLCLTRVCDSVHRGGGSRTFSGGSPSRGSLRLCPGGSLSRGSQTLSRVGGLGPGGSLSKGVSVRGVSVRGISVWGVSIWNAFLFPKYLSKNCLLERINSLQWYELTRRCSPLPLMLPSPLTYVVYPWSVHCKSSIKQN